MTAIDRTLLENLRFVEDAESLKDTGFITNHQLLKAETQFRLPNTNERMLLRAAFFMLGMFLYSSVIGAISFVSISVSAYYKAMIFFYAAIALITAEFLARKNYYRHGLDDAFILIAQIVMVGAVGVTSESPAAAFLTLGILGVLSAIRYVNTFSAVLTIIGFAGLISHFVIEGGVLGKVYLPFILLIFSAVIYIIVQRLRQKAQLFYESVLSCAKVSSLILGYLSVNYLVVREMSDSLMGVNVPAGGDIPMAWIFYVLTFLIPVGLLIFGILNKQKELLHVGILTFAFSIFSIKYYHKLLPLDISLIVGGAALFLATAYLMQKLKSKTSGVTIIRDRFDNRNLELVQMVMANTQTGEQAVEKVDSPMQFGGGGFSGGGSGGSF